MLRTNAAKKTKIFVIHDRRNAFPFFCHSCEIFADEAWWGELWQTYPDGYWSAWNHWIEGSIGDDVSMPACPSGLVHDWKKQTNAEEQ